MNSRIRELKGTFAVSMAQGGDLGLVAVVAEHVLRLGDRLEVLPTGRFDHRGPNHVASDQQRSGRRPP